MLYNTNTGYLSDIVVELHSIHSVLEYISPSNERMLHVMNSIINQVSIGFIELAYVRLLSEREYLFMLLVPSKLDNGIVSRMKVTSNYFNALYGLEMHIRNEP